MQWKISQRKMRKMFCCSLLYDVVELKWKVERKTVEMKRNEIFFFLNSLLCCYHTFYHTYSHTRDEQIRLLENFFFSCVEFSHQIESWERMSEVNDYICSCITKITFEKLNWIISYLCIQLYSTWYDVMWWNWALKGRKKVRKK